MKNFLRFFTIERVLIALLLIVLLWAFYNYSFSKTSFLDNMTSTTAPPSTAATPTAVGTPSLGGMQPVTNPNDLLPTDSHAAWGQANQDFLPQGNVAMPDLLDAGYHIGLDTIGQSLRNPNYDLRSAPIIPKQNVGPWNNSTIEPDLGRIPLEIGSGST